MNIESDTYQNEDFLLLIDLLNAAEDYAEERACYLLKNEEMGLLDRMARGECGKEERKQAIELLVANREAMEYFACALNGKPYEPVSTF